MPSVEKYECEAMDGFDHFRRSGLGEVHEPGLEEGHVLEHRVVLLVEDEHVRRQRELVVAEARRGTANRDEAIGVGVGERLQQHAVDDAEDRGDGAEAERQRERGDDQETRLFQQQAASVADIVNERVHGRTPEIVGGAGGRQADSVILFRLGPMDQAHARGSARKCHNAGGRSALSCRRRAPARPRSCLARLQDVATSTARS